MDEGGKALAAGACVIVACSTLAATSAASLPPRVVDFATVNAHRPVAGQMFEGITIINRTGLEGHPERFTAIRCDAEIGTTRLPARKLIYGVPRLDGVQVVVCGWRIPADAAGQTLRFWPNFHADVGAYVRVDNTHILSWPATWRVMKSQGHLTGHRWPTWVSFLGIGLLIVGLVSALGWVVRRAVRPPRAA